MIVDEDDYLEHFGVKGMRWGVVNEDKASSGSSRRQERREAAAKKFDSKAENYGSRIDIINEKLPTMKYNRKRGKLLSEKRELVDAKKNAEDSAKAKREGKLTPKQKKALKAAAITAGVLAAYGTYRMVQSGEFNRKMIKGKAFLDGNQGSPWNLKQRLSDPKLSTDDIMKDVVSHINPGYGGVGTKVNCRRCTFAYEMRRRGFDVAATKTTTGLGQAADGLYNSLSPDAKLVRPGSSGIISRLTREGIRRGRDATSEAPFIDMVKGMEGLSKNAIEEGSSGFGSSIFRTLAKQPNGSRGELGLSWMMGGGHSVAYEVVNNRPVIFDTQTGQRYRNARELLNGYEGVIGTASYTRLDNLELNTDFLMRWLRNAG